MKWYNHRSYPSDKLLDSLILNLLHDEIVDITLTDFELSITFSNDFTLMVWDENRYYAWLSRGKITYNGKIFYEWTKKMPTNKTMNILYNRIYPYPYSYG